MKLKQWRVVGIKTGNVYALFSDYEDAVEFVEKARMDQYLAHHPYSILRNDFTAKELDAHR